MDTSKMLSGGGLVSRGVTKSNSSLPESGQKEITPTGTWLEHKQIQSALDARRQLLEVERIEKLGSLSVAIWRDDLKLAEVIKKAGSHWQYMGHNVGKHLYLLPEETLYLIETNSLYLKYNDVPVSLQTAYALCLSDIDLAQYKVYASLSRLGYRVFRHSVAHHKQTNRDEPLTDTPLALQNMNSMQNSCHQINESMNIVTSQKHSENKNQTRSENSENIASNSSKSHFIHEDDSKRAKTGQGNERKVIVLGYTTINLENNKISGTNIDVEGHNTGPMSHTDQSITEGTSSVDVGKESTNTVIGKRKDVDKIDTGVPHDDVAPRQNIITRIDDDTSMAHTVIVNTRNVANSNISIANNIDLSVNKNCHNYCGSLEPNFHHSDVIYSVDESGVIRGCVPGGPRPECRTFGGEGDRLDRYLGRKIRTFLGRAAARASRSAAVAFPDCYGRKAVIARAPPAALLPPNVAPAGSARSLDLERIRGTDRASRPADRDTGARGGRRPLAVLAPSLFGAGWPLAAPHPVPFYRLLCAAYTARALGPRPPAVPPPGGRRRPPPEVVDVDAPETAPKRARPDRSRRDALEELARELRALAAARGAAPAHRRAMARALRAYNRDCGATLRLSAALRVVDGARPGSDSAAPAPRRRLRNPFSAVGRARSPEERDAGRPDPRGRFPAAWLPPADDFGRPEAVSAEEARLFASAERLWRGARGAAGWARSKAARLAAARARGAAVRPQRSLRGGPPAEVPEAPPQPERARAHFDVYAGGGPPFARTSRPEPAFRVFCVDGGRWAAPRGALVAAGGGLSLVRLTRAPAPRLAPDRS